MVNDNEIHQPADFSSPRSAREKQRWRNAVARRKLEELGERKLLRKQLTDVWDEPGNPRWSQ